jgi:hypothetical protein
VTPTDLATLTVPAATGYYALLCWIKPFGRCRACKATGMRPTLIARRLRPCRRCKGAGLRRRTGRTLYVYAVRIHRDATTAKATRSKASR